jgi:hypothetical protein
MSVAAPSARPGEQRPSPPSSPHAHDRVERKIDQEDEQGLGERRVLDEELRAAEYHDRRGHEPKPAGKPGSADGAEQQQPAGQPEQVLYEDHKRQMRSQRMHPLQEYGIAPDS